MHKRSSISLSPKGLQNINATEDEFTFVIGNDQYHVPAALAEFISPTVSKLRKLDKSTSTFTIPIEDECGRFRHILKLMKGSPIEITSIDAQMLRYFAEKLGNGELYENLSHLQCTELNKDTVVEILLSKYRINLPYDKELQYIAYHFSEIPIDHRMRIPLTALELIISCAELKVQTEDDLFNFINQLVKHNGKSYRILYQYVLFEYLDEQSVAQFVEETNPSDINTAVWAAIGRRLRMKVNPSLLEKEERFSKGTIPFIGNPFDGIVKYLRKESGQNPHTNGQIKITYQGGNPYCEKLFDFDWKCYWSSTNSPGQWLSFDFTKNYIYLTDYTLKTPNSSPGWNHLKSWVIEGSIDGIEWVEMDSRNDNFDLNGNSKIATYHCQNPHKVRLIRLRQTGKNHRNADDIQLTNIEFFGRVTDAEDIQLEHQTVDAVAAATNTTNSAPAVVEAVPEAAPASVHAD
ncbi:F5/8 type C domain containing protein [Tritrichomonas foetus]|uniref:F5/8 type C domain containing protein n=1 Tax=Tritrichomonas foetus TaxID=1144522 RepID=A0A1J4L1F7_9EUKA|nr:F5/8 type C domain containing protein [Tritrichomonas foetus]|eukprot:OHT17275.1 F5/8 type C domain containing protein [Tritrichomonas foetus]